MKTTITALALITLTSCGGLFANQNPDELVVDACRVRLATRDVTGETPVDPQIRKACAAIVAASEQE